MEKVILNKLPVATFGWLNVNGAERDIESFGTGEEVFTELTGTAGSPAEAEISGGRQRFLINAKNGAEKKAIIYISGDEGATLDIEVKAQAGSRVKLVEVFEHSGAVLNEVKADIGEGAGFELVQLYIGGKDIVSGTDAKLTGRNAEFTADIGYLLEGKEKLDINLVADHRGKKSSSEINVRGVLGDEAEKVFRGTIDFKNGAVGAKGAENEEVLLMDEKVRNKTVPLILCAEEDVEGSHGASIGRIDEGQVFYMESRGIPREKIYELMARAKIAQVAAKIGHEATEQRIAGLIGGGEESE